MKTGNGSPKLQATDTSQFQKPASFLRRGDPGRVPEKQHARLAKQFIQQNEGLLRDMGVDARIDYDGSDVTIIFETGTKVGAIPLLSPTTGQPEYTFLVTPKFEWSGIGPLLGEMGWRVVPKPLALPTLPHSAKHIPPWVLSSMVLKRMDQLIKNLGRSFQETKETRSAPKGQVDWNEYITSSMARGKFLDVPCRYSTLSEQRELKRAIHYTLQNQLTSLQTQRKRGVVVRRLIEYARNLIQVVNDVHPKKPSSQTLQQWENAPLNRDAFQDGLQAIEWTIENRGLAGHSTFEGVPWMMSMEKFFESWVEHIFSNIARQIGAELKVGRKDETVVPIDWDPPYYGSQNSLRPDLRLEKGNMTYIIDAKYKHHLQQFQQRAWHEVTDKIRERHRHDLLQVLAYSSATGTQNISACLLYPETKELWKQRLDEDQIFHEANIRSGDKFVRVLMGSVPLHDSQFDLFSKVFKYYFH